MSSAAMNTDVLGDRSWRRRHSAWLLAPVLGFGLFSFVGFVYCAIRVKERKWVVLAVVAVVLTVLGWIFISAWTDANGQASTAAITYLLELWLVSVIFACLVNRDYLNWRATVATSSTYGTTLPARHNPARPPAAGWYLDPEAQDRVRYWDGHDWTRYTAPRPR